jgi:hypothetical protein
MPTLSLVRNRVDNKLADVFWPIILDRQLKYKDGVYTEEEVEDTDPESPTYGETIMVRTYSAQPHNTYWQGFKTHSIEPNHTTAYYGDSVPDNLASKPDDVEGGWSDILPEVDTSLPAVFSFDVYNGPSGQGFVTTVYVRYNDTLYSRSHNYGPEMERELYWHEVGEE